MIAKAISASLIESEKTSNSISKTPDFLISSIEKENIYLFSELMTRLVSNGGYKDPDLESLSKEMQYLLDKMIKGYEKDQNVAFPGDIRKTINILKESINNYNLLPREDEQINLYPTSSNCKNQPNQYSHVMPSAPPTNHTNVLKLNTDTRMNSKKTNSSLIDL